MAGVCVQGKAINTVTASGHVSYNIWTSGYCSSYNEDGSCANYVNGYNTPYTTSATINGTVGATASTVFVNNTRVTLNGDPTAETETYTVPSNASDVSSDGGGNGQVTSGNSRGVFANGKLIAIVGSSVRTHAGVNTTVKNGSANVFIG